MDRKIIITGATGFVGRILVTKLVEKNVALGKTSKVYGTPTFFINGEPLVGPDSLRDFEKLLR